MAEVTHSISLAIDAGAAKAGSDQFVAAIARVKQAVADLERDTSGAFKQLRKGATIAVDSSGASKARADLEEAGNSVATFGDAARRATIAANTALWLRVSAACPRLARTAPVRGQV